MVKDRQVKRLWKALSSGKRRCRQGRRWLRRRPTVQLKQPTRDGEKVIHLLTNLRPEQADALRVGVLYCERWQVETAFQELTVDLACEVSTLWDIRKPPCSRSPWP